MSLNRFLEKLLQFANMELKLFIARLRAQNNLVLVHTKNGYPMYVFLNDRGLSRQLIVYGQRETLATNYFKKDLENGMNILECGANIGYYTLLALHSKKNCRVIAFEPVKENVDLLKKNLILNNCKDRVKIYPFAVGEKNKIANFYVSSLSNAGGMASKTFNSVETRKVRTVKLDTFLKSEDKIDYVRMDVEGYEINIIKGMHGILSGNRRPKKLFIEIHPTYLSKLGSSINEFIKLVLNYGYKFRTAFYEGSSIISPKASHIFTELETFMQNPEYETRSAQVFFERSK